MVCRALAAVHARLLQELQRQTGHCFGALSHHHTNLSLGICLQGTLHVLQVAERRRQHCTPGTSRNGKLGFPLLPSAVTFRSLVVFCCPAVKGPHLRQYAARSGRPQCAERLGQCPLRSDPVAGALSDRAGQDLRTVQGREGRQERTELHADLFLPIIPRCSLFVGRDCAEENARGSPLPAGASGLEFGPAASCCSAGLRRSAGSHHSQACQQWHRPLHLLSQAVFAARTTCTALLAVHHLRHATCLSSSRPAAGAVFWLQKRQPVGRSRA